MSTCKDCDNYKFCLKPSRGVCNPAEDCNGFIPVDWTPLKRFYKRYEEKEKPSSNDKQWPKVNPILHYNLNELGASMNKVSDSVVEMSRKLSAYVTNITDKAIVDAVVRHAKTIGIDDLFLIDEDYIVSALKHERELRQNGVVYLNDN